MRSDNDVDKKDTSADIVVVGGGGAGLAAAVAASEKGTCSIIVLEKRGDLGGNTALSHNLFAVESPAQKRAGIVTRRDDFFKASINWSRWKVNPRIVRAFIDKSGDTISWLEDKGLRFKCIPLYDEQVIVVMHTTEGRGAAITRCLAEACNKLGITVYTNTQATKLITDGKGNITGVLAENNGKEFTITAKSVIISTGGYVGNKQLLKKHFPDYTDNIEAHGISNTGDGLLMAMEIGAANEGLGVFLGGGGMPGPYPSITLKLGTSPDVFELPLIAIASEPNVIWVNKKGERFGDEAYLSGHHPACANAVNRQPDSRAFTIFDQGIVNSATWEGMAGGYLHIVPKGTGLTGFERELRVLAKEGWVKISESLDDIAEWIGADGKALKATVNEYNACCEKGYDTIFAKDAKYLVPLRTPPYYAIRGRMDESDRVFFLLDTIGGIKVNERMEVLDKQNSPIAGLYAAGVVAGGWEAIWDDSMNSGNPASFAVNSGRIAAENAFDSIADQKRF